MWCFGNEAYMVTKLTYRLWWKKKKGNIFFLAGKVVSTWPQAEDKLNHTLCLGHVSLDKTAPW